MKYLVLLIGASAECHLAVPNGFSIISQCSWNLATIFNKLSEILKNCGYSGINHMQHLLVLQNQFLLNVKFNKILSSYRHNRY